MKTLHNEMAVVENGVAPLAKQAASIVVDSKDTLKEAVSFLSKLNQTLDRITIDKEKVTRPLNDALKAERARWKPFETMLETAIDQVRTAMTRYQTEQHRLAKEEEARIAARIGDGKGKIKVETAIKKIEEIDRPDSRVDTEDGLVKFRTERKFEVMDITMVPHEYLLPNESKIRADMKKGIEISGVRYYDEQVPMNFR